MKRFLNLLLWPLMALCLAFTWLHAQALPDIPPDLQNKPFSEWQLNITTLIVVAAALGRLYSGLRKGGGLVGIFRGVVFGENVPKPIADDYKVELNKPADAGLARSLLLIGTTWIAIAVAGTTAAVMFTACAGGAIKVNPAGPSHGDVVTYDYKLAIVTQHQLLQSFLDWEAANPIVGQQTPAIHDLALRVRNDLPAKFREANEAYKAYAALRNAPTPDLDRVAAARAVLQAALQVLERYVKQTTPAMVAAASAPAN